MPSDLRYLLHLRRERDASLSVSLRAISDGQLQTFADLEELLTFLEGQAAQTLTRTTGTGPA